MNLKTMLFGGYAPPDVPSRLVCCDNDPLQRIPEVKVTNQEFGRLATKRAIERANSNAKRIKNYMIKHPWCTAAELCKALGLTKTPVYNHLTRFKEGKQVEVRTRRAGNYTLVSYNWRGE